MDSKAESEDATERDAFAKLLSESVLNEEGLGGRNLK